MPSILERWRLFSHPVVVNVSVKGDASTQVLNLSAKELYQTQDNLQAVVNYLTNSIAQLPLKVYVREGETDRKRDRTSDAAKTLYMPNMYQTQFEFIKALVAELFVFGTVYVWTIPSLVTPSGYEIYIVPSEWIESSESECTYGPDSIRIRTKAGGTAVDVPKEEFVQFKIYSPGNPGGYISPIAALRQTLQEQVEASRFRRQLWRSSGRLNAQIVRPKDVEPWSDEQKKNFITAFREAWGSGGSKAGSIPLLEDGMEIKPFSTSFKESEWSQSVKLSRESVAAAYGVNPSLIWHSDTQTYASSKDNARALYTECLGPTIQMLQQRINVFLLPKLGATPETYVEVDLEEKLKGSFEERASILQTSVGAPWLTRNEARADMNLPPKEGGDDLITPLNVETSGQANPGNDYDYEGEDNQAKTVRVLTLKKCDCKDCKTETELHIKGKSDEEDDEKVTEVLKKFFERQGRSVIPKISSGSDWWNSERWDKELAEDLEPILIEIADKHGKEAAEELDWNYDTEVTRKYLSVTAQKRAQNINKQTQKRLEKDLEEEEPDSAHVFEVRANTADTLGRAAATAVASWAVRESAHQAQSDGAPSVIKKVVLKRWVTGENSRPSHAAMNGEIVPIDADFSNGQFWPGDSDDPDESCGCNCSTEVVIQ